ncbi:MAG: hypothetical protein J7493_14075 [Porphyrobacter sp.]|nr:hypothetical protein [Porphyrobacter sp.]
MAFRSVTLVLFATFLCAATEAPPPPPVLQPYIKDGKFDPGDYGWLRGRFQDASAEEAAAYEAFLQWSQQCWTTAHDELRANLAAEGYPDAKVDNVNAAPLLCRTVASQPMITDNSSFKMFERELATATPVALAYVTAARNADEAARPRSKDLASELKARTVGEQTIRMGLTWAMREDSDFPEMSPLARAIVRAHIGLAMAEYDHANTEWLKSVVAENGWPKISEVGEDASGAAWLLVQHADADPVFQLRALNLMEPLVAQKEVSARDYAYLTDRIALKLTGKQRYGTQYQCVDGAYAPLPIADEAAVERLREEAGMESLAENAARMQASYGRC